MEPSSNGPVQVVGLGLATLDVLVRLREMPAWGRYNTFSGFALDGGGMTGTAMVAACRLGARAGYVGTVGTGLAGELKRRSLADHGVDLRCLRPRPQEERWVILVCVHEETGERTFCGWSGAKDSLRPDELDRSYITSARYLLLDGGHLEAALVAADWMRQAGGKVVYDGSKTDSGEVSASQRPLLGKVDVLICASGFAPALTGERDLARAGRAALAHLAPGAVVVQTEGADGSYTTTADEHFHTPAFPVKVVDTTGAGDVFHGAYIVGLLHGWAHREAGVFASAVAAIKCTALGGRAGIPTLDQTMQFLRERGVDPA